MTPDLYAQLADVLALWHAWQRGAKVGRGFNSRALVVGDFRNVQVQYDSQLDQHDVDIESSRSRAVDFEVRQMANPWQTAIYQDARNCYTGVSVWSSPRLPRDPLAREIIVEEARQMLAARLISVGVLEQRDAA